MPYGAAETLFYSADHEVILEGPADTGKSRACLEKLHACMEEWPGSRSLILRKTRKSLTQSAMVTYEKKVLPEGSGVRFHTGDQEYRYPNGSIIAVGGLDDADKVMSMEYDVVYVQEAREITEDDWEKCRSRCRWGNMPYWQVMGDTNPDAPRHWIKLRGNRGQTTLLPSRHKDNPSFTPARQEILDGLTGVRRDRLRDGHWVAAEGMIYEGWDDSVHLVDHRALPVDWSRYLAIDFGHTEPFVCQWWAKDPDGRLYRYREIYHTKQLVEDLAHEIRRLSDGERIKAIVCDHDAEDRATLERHLSCLCPGASMSPGIPCGTTGARKDVSPGLQAVSQRLRPDGTGRPRLLLVRDALVQRDSLLDERKLPCCTEDEIPGYIWAERKVVGVSGEVRMKEEPIDKDNHGMDAMRYMVAYFDLRDPRESLMMRTAPLVQGTRPVQANQVPPKPAMPAGFPEIKGFG